MDLSSFALEQVSKTGIRYLTKPDHIVMCCPVHSGGQERTPSRKINLTNPRFKPLESYCYACNDEKKTLSWNELAAITNMAPIRADEDAEGEDGEPLWLSIPPAEDFYGSESTEIAKHPWKGAWRGINAKMMKQIGASEVNSRDEPRIYIPIYVDGVEVGNVQCVEDTKSEEASKIKYLISGKWSTYTMYPVDISFPLAEKLGYIVVVEGMRDALKLVQWGVPAVCIWGTNAWTRAKRDTLLELDVKIVIATDDDEPGDNVRKKIEADIKAHRGKVAHLRFADGRDPGSLTKDEVLEIAEIFGSRPANDNNSLLQYFLDLRGRYVKNRASHS